MATDRYVSFCMERVELLIRHGVTPLLVFDGADLPSKAQTEDGRRAKRERALAAAKLMLAQGRRGAAHALFTEAVDVTPTVAHRLLQVLRRRGVSFIIAPYEADAQLAYLSEQGIADVIITEDSDALPYRCRRVCFKLDKDGFGVDVKRLPAASFFRKIDQRDGQSVDAINLTGFRDDTFLDMCILCGCDYSPSLPGLGIKAAWKLVRERKSLEGVLAHIHAEGLDASQRDYADLARRAKQTFVYQRVWDPKSRRCVTLHPAEAAHEWGITPPPADASDFLGPVLEDSLATAIAEGLIHPVTREPYESTALVRAPSLPSDAEEQLSAPTSPSGESTAVWRVLNPRPTGTRQDASTERPHQAALGAFFTTVQPTTTEQNGGPRGAAPQSKLSMTLTEDRVFAAAAVHAMREAAVIADDIIIPEDRLMPRSAASSSPWASSFASDAAAAVAAAVAVRRRERLDALERPSDQPVRTSEFFASRETDAREVTTPSTPALPGAVVTSSVSLPILPGRGTAPRLPALAGVVEQRPRPSFLALRRAGADDDVSTPSAAPTHTVTVPISAGSAPPQRSGCMSATQADAPDHVLARFAFRTTPSTVAAHAIATAATRRSQPTPRTPQVSFDYADDAVRDDSTEPGSHSRPQLGVDLLHAFTRARSDIGFHSEVAALSSADQDRTVSTRRLFFGDRRSLAAAAPFRRPRSAEDDGEYYTDSMVPSDHHVDGNDDEHDDHASAASRSLSKRVMRIAALPGVGRPGERFVESRPLSLDRFRFSGPAASPS